MAESRRLQAVQSPVIPDVAALIRATPGTISLGQGVVHYGPPQEVFDAVARFGRQVAEHHYHPASGLPELVQELHDKLALENGIEVQNDQVIMVTAGSNMAFSHTVLAIADPGDEIILLAPFFFNHEMAVVMANCRPVVVPTDAHYQPRLDAIEAVLSPRTRALVTVSPNNPAGAVYPPQTLRAINQLCLDRAIYHIVDEAYEYFTYEDAQHFSPGSRSVSRGHTISLFSFSKSYGLASWRVGYMVAPRPLLSALEKIQDTILICPPVISQIAALGALRAGSSYCRTFIQDIARVRQLCLEHLSALEDCCQIPPAPGAFYLLVQLDTNRPAMEVVEYLIRNYQVAVIPGTAFGLHQGCYIRIAYGALQEDTAAAGMDRLVSGLQHFLKR